MFHYQGYGLEIQSAVPLPELPEVNRSGRIPDVTIQFGRVPCPEKVSSHRTDEELAVVKGVATFLIRQNSEIVVDPSPETSMEQLSRSIMFSAMIGILRQRGLFILHGSAIALDGHAILFLGHSGQGKSTTAAAFSHLGCRVLTDDIAAIRNLDGSCQLIPGYPRLRLHEEAAHLLESPKREFSPPMEVAEHKRSYSIANRFQSEPTPVKRIYLLTDGEELKIERVDPQTTFRELFRLSFLRKRAASAGVKAQHFRQFQQLVDLVPVRRLIRPRNLTLLPALAGTVKHDLGLTAEGV
jgi:hypothetical protein